jgi:Uma2 family endonuclease
VVKPSERVAVHYTYDDYLNFPDDGKRYQIIHGELFVTPAPSSDHQSCIVVLVALLYAHVSRHQLGRVFVAPYDVLFKKDSVVQPDLLYIARAHENRIKKTHLEGAPDLVVEALSPRTTTLDRTKKRDLYAENRVPHYWIFDPRKKTIEVYRLSRKEYRLEEKVEGDATFTPRLFPGLQIPLSEVFRKP